MIETNRRKVVQKYILSRSRFPAVCIPAVRVGPVSARGVILFHWLFIGIEREVRLNCESISLVWSFGLKPIGRF